MLFRLISTYEKISSTDVSIQPIRIEVFEAVDEAGLYRARIWTRATYNLYPSFANLDASGNDLKKMHSSDDLNQEITNLIFSDIQEVVGTNWKSEAAFLDSVLDKIAKFYK